MRGTNHGPRPSAGDRFGVCPKGELIMPKMTAGYAKNTIRRSLRAVLDPEPIATDIERLWEHFHSACAYCDRTLSRANREGHIDHLISAGTNHVSNRVLSCASCNGDEKREGDWLEFLRKKAPDEATFLDRRERIQSWCSTTLTAKQHGLDTSVQVEIDRVITTFDNAVANLRQLRQSLPCSA